MLGNTVRSSTQKEQALKLYQEATQKAINPLTKVESLLNQLSLLIEIRNQNCSSQSLPCQEKKDNREAIQALLPSIKSELANLFPCREAIYAQVNFAGSLIKILSPEFGELSSKNQRSQLTKDAALILAQAVQQAKILKDPRAESYALGQLGALYEETQQLSEAQKLTQEALVIAQGINASDIIARSWGQLGKILQQQGNIPSAIAAYTEAVNNLQSLRSDLVAIPDWQFSFRESVEPVYRELVGLLLQSNPNQNNLKQAREVIEKLQIAELDNFFREACLNVKPEQIEKFDPQAAVIYPIILPDRLAVILSIPGQPLQHYATALPQNKVEKTLEKLIESLNPFFSSRERLGISQQIYDWLIRPGEAEIAQNKVKTLVFVLDGLLRNLPMAALYDGKQYLVEKYNIALAPGLQLVASRSLSKEKLKILTGGITEARQGFSALPGVKIEVEQIASGRTSKIFLNEDFTETNLKKQLEVTSFPVVHLATHGQFSSNAEDTFILSWNEKIQAKEFENLLRNREQGRRNPLELLVLSACQTAVGDKRAALGLAGVAVRSGARSTLATLWSVQDQSTAWLMTEFYQQLSQGIGKAEALRKAQQYMMKQPKYEHPFYWAPFILVGNWL
jgi:CHAT domain-containing protein